MSSGSNQSSHLRNSAQAILSSSLPPAIDNAIQQSVLRRPGGICRVGTERQSQSHRSVGCARESVDPDPAREPEHAVVVGLARALQCDATRSKQPGFPGLSQFIVCKPDVGS